MVECCQAIDSSSDATPDEALSLQKASDLMNAWAKCQDEAEQTLPCKKLGEPLQNFRKILFAKMQNGFLEKRDSIKITLVKSITEITERCPLSKNKFWPAFKTTIDDYLWLAAEVFSVDERAEMKALGDAAEIFRLAAFAGCLD